LHPLARSISTGDVGDLQRLMNRDSIGRELTLRVDRGGQTLTVGIVPRELTD
jgi:hypothetical protein